MVVLKLKALPQEEDTRAWGVLPLNFLVSLTALVKEEQPRLLQLPTVLHNSKATSTEMSPALRTLVWT